MTTKTVFMFRLTFFLSYIINVFTLSYCKSLFINSSFPVKLKSNKTVFMFYYDQQNFLSFVGNCLCCIVD